MKPAVEKIVEKTIKAVVISEDNHSGPNSQVFLVFNDDTYFEFYGDIRCAGNLNLGAEDGALEYARKAAGKITIYGDVQV